MGTTELNSSLCHWKNCPQQPVAWAALGSLPNIIIIHPYCQEHADTIQEIQQQNSLSMDTPHGRQHVDELIIQAIP